jgi:hypothetical protein
MVKAVVEKMKGKTSGTISVAAILGVVVQGYLGYQENKTKSAQSGFVYNVVRELKADNDEALDKLDEISTRLARLEGRTEGLKDAVHLLQDRSLKRRDRAEAIEELLSGDESAFAPPDPEPDEALAGGAGGGVFSGSTEVTVEAAEEATAPAMAKPRRHKKRKGRRSKPALPLALPDSVQEVEQAQQQLQEVFD